MEKLEPISTYSLCVYKSRSDRQPAAAYCLGDAVLTAKLPRDRSLCNRTGYNSKDLDQSYTCIYTDMNKTTKLYIKVYSALASLGLALGCLLYAIHTTI
jgi:hypothetical protein